MKQTGAKGVYKSTKQEALRKAMIAKIWTQARIMDLEKFEVYDAIKEWYNGGAITLYFDNWQGRGESRRVSLSTLKNWQLKQVLNALFPTSGKGAKIVNMEELANDGRSDA